MAFRAARTPQPGLSDGIVSLRPPEERDEAAINMALHDPEIVRWFGQPTQTASAVLEANRRRAAEGSPTFVVCRAPEDDCLGHIWINVSSTDATSGTVGYWLLPGARGGGLITRAMRLIAVWVPVNLGLTQLDLITASDNARSRAVATRAGFREVQVLPRVREIDGRAVEEIRYRLSTASYPLDAS
jgi:RimJ/RimL family protein N-acetyltransferase